MLFEKFAVESLDVDVVDITKKPTIPASTMPAAVENELKINRSLPGPIPVSNEQKNIEQKNIQNIPDKTKKLINTLKQFNKSGKPLDNDFWLEFIAMCGRMNADPIQLARVIRMESNFDPAREGKNENGKIIAKGLNMFLLPVGKNLGMSEDFWKNKLQFTSAKDQLKWVELFYKGGNSLKKNMTAADISMRNLGGYSKKHFNNPHNALYISKGMLRQLLKTNERMALGLPGWRVYPAGTKEKYPDLKSKDRPGTNVPEANGNEFSDEMKKYGYNFQEKAYASNSFLDIINPVGDKAKGYIAKEDIPAAHKGMSRWTLSTVYGEPSKHVAKLSKEQLRKRIEKNKKINT